MSKKKVSISVYECLAASVFGIIFGCVQDGAAKCPQTTLGRKAEIILYEPVFTVHEGDGCWEHTQELMS
jgi:hypothetical protein